MKNINRSILIISILFLISIVYVYCDENYQKADYLDTRQISTAMYAHDIFRPAGWSSDGKFAFIRESFVDGRGGVKFFYSIFDTVGDVYSEIIEDDSFDWEPEIDYSAISPEGYYSFSYTMKKQEWQYLLKKYNIESEQDVELNRFPLNTGEAVYEPIIEYIFRNKDDEFYSFKGKIQGITVYIEKDNKRKIIYINEEMDSWDCWNGGYFLSPFEKRILVVIGTEEPGFEGTKGSFILSGCHLNFGF